MVLCIFGIIMDGYPIGNDSDSDVEGTELRLSKI